MGYKALEDALRRKLLRRRIILGVLTLVFFILGVVCSSLREATREVIVHDYGFFTRDEIVYNNAYVPFIVIGFMGAFTTFILCVTDLLSCRYETIEVNGYYLTVYRGAIGNYVYVDGEEKDSLIMYGHYIEISLPDRTVVNLAFARSMLEWCHISFSDGRKSIDL